MVTRDFFQNPSDAALSGNWIEIPFGFTASSQTIDNDDAAKSLEFSYTGGAKHGILTLGESITFNDRSRNKVYLRDADPSTAATSGTSYRIFAWGKGG